MTDAPPTLAPPTSVTLTSIPTPETAPSPSAVADASPGRAGPIYPIISNIQPAAGSALPPGDVVIGARITGANNLVSVVAFVDGDPYQPSVGPPATRSIAFSFVRPLELGTHEVRIEARDERGQAGGYRWHFNVGERRPLPTVSRPSTPTEGGPPPTLPVPPAPTRPASVDPSPEAPRIR